MTALSNSQSVGKISSKMLEKPIFIIGAPRSGNTWLGRVIENHESVVCWEENNNIWTWGNTHKPDDVLTEKDVTPKIKNYLREQFDLYLTKHSGNRVCDKTPRNCLKIPFIHKIFPDAKFVMLLRDGRSVINSTRKELHRGEKNPFYVTLKSQIIEAYRRLQRISVWEWYTYLPSLKSRIKKVLGMRLDYWGVRPPGWKEWINHDPEHILLAKQWAAAIAIATEFGRSLPPEKYLEVRYEDLMTSPQTEILRVADFLELEDPGALVKCAVESADSSRIYKWKHEIEIERLNEVQHIIEPVMQKLGYTW